MSVVVGLAFLDLGQLRRTMRCQRLRINLDLDLFLHYLFFLTQINGLFQSRLNSLCQLQRIFRLDLQGHARTRLQPLNIRVRVRVRVVLDPLGTQNILL